MVGKQNKSSPALSENNFLLLNIARQERLLLAKRDKCSHAGLSGEHRIKAASKQGPTTSDIAAWHEMMKVSLGLGAFQR